MTTVIVAPRFENPLTSTEDIPTNGGVQIRLSKTSVVGSQWITDAWSPEKKFTGVPINFDLDPVAGIPYEIYLYFRDGKGEKFELTEFRIITDQGSPTRWETFELSGAPGTAPPITSNLEARVAALEAAVPSGPATNVINVSGISAYSRTYLDDANGPAVLATIGGALDSDTVHKANVNESVDGIKTFVKSPVVPTATTTGQAVNKGQLDTAISGVASGSGISGAPSSWPSTFPPTLPIAQSGITGLTTLASTVATHTSQIAGLSSPFIRETSPGTYPNRDVTAAGVMRVYIGTVPPPAGGTVSSGTTAVDNLDGWWRIS